MHIDALIHTFRLLDILDIFVVAIGIYYLYKMLKDTRAVALLKGIESSVKSIRYQLDFATKYDCTPLCVTSRVPT